MNVQEKMQFLQSKIKEINQITNDLEAVFPEKSFTLDGILIGNIVELMAAQAYGIALYKQSEKTHDGEVDGRKVQIKGTQKADSIVIRELPEHLLVLYLDKDKGIIREIYNGPGSLVWEYRSYVPSMNFYTIRVNKLLEMADKVNVKDRIIPVLPVDKFEKDISSGFIKKKIHRKQGKTLLVGYINRNNQENCGCLNKPGTHVNQLAYLLKCNACGFEYESNGCDIAIRKCPNCM